MGFDKGAKVLGQGFRLVTRNSDVEPFRNYV